MKKFLSLIGFKYEGTFYDIERRSKRKFKKDFEKYPFFIKFMEEFSDVMVGHRYYFDFEHKGFANGIFARTGGNGCFFNLFGEHSVAEFLHEAIREKCFSFYVHAPNTGNHIGMGVLGYFVSYRLNGTDFIRHEGELEWHVEKQLLVGDFPSFSIKDFK